MNRLSALHAVYFVSGIPALMYQIVWQRVLSLYFGVDVDSVAITVASFMMGLGFGALAGGWFADRVARPIWAYAAVELAAGVVGFASIALLTAVGEALAGAPLAVVAVVTFALLLFPTSLMGATIPLMSRSVIASNSGMGNRFARLYALNTLGAAVNALFCSYVAIGSFGLDGTAILAAVINIGLAAAGAWLGLKREHREPPVLDETPTEDVSARLIGVSIRWRLLLCSFLSGFVALGYELVWYRLLTTLLKGTVYVLGTILAVFLIGIAGGSWVARSRADLSNAIGRFARAQVGTSVFVSLFSIALANFTWLPGVRHLLGATTFTTFHPAPEILSTGISLRSLYSAADIFIWVVAFVGVPTFLMGYGFPFLVRASVSTFANLGVSIGRTYFANILGATAGSVVAGFVLLQYGGSEISLLVLIVLGCVTAAIAPVPSNHRPWLRSVRWQAVVVAAVSVVVFPMRGELLRSLHYADFADVEFVAAEDRSGVVARRTQRRIISFAEEAQILDTERILIDGVHHGGFGDTEASTDALRFDPSVALTLAAHPRPSRVLLIGLGDGRMAMAAVDAPEVKEVMVVELSSVLPELLRSTPQGHHLFGSPKLSIVHDDGRRWLSAHPRERFDVIVMWPLHAAHAYSGNLFSMEFFALARRHLSPGGLLFLRTVDEFSTARTVAQSFAHLVALKGGAYVASDQPFRFSAQRFGASENEIEAWLRMDRDAILSRTRGAALNWDLHPRSEYYLTYEHVAALQTWGTRSDTPQSFGSSGTRSWIAR